MEKANGDDNGNSRERNKARAHVKCCLARLEQHDPQRRSEVQGANAPHSILHCLPSFSG
jgi:hypothetical protein